MFLFALLGIRRNLRKYPEANLLSTFPSSGTAKFLTTVNVRTGPGTSYKAVSTYSKGETVKYDKLVTGDSRTWISYISSSGSRHYCCAIDKDGSKYISVGGSTPTPTTTSKVSLPIPLYYQWNYKTKYGDGTIATCGCGPTSFAMVASYLKGKKITPPDAVSWCGNKYYVKGVGTAWSYFKAASSHFGCGSVTQTGTSSTAHTAIKNKKPVICSQGPGIFTKGGHFIVLRGYSGSNGVLVNDPNDNSSKNFKNRVFNFNTEVAKTASQYWIFKAK